jgi:hypothetical protein
VCTLTDKNPYLIYAYKFFLIYFKRGLSQFVYFQGSNRRLIISYLFLFSTTSWLAPPQNLNAKLVWLLQFASGSWTWCGSQLPVLSSFYLCLAWVIIIRRWRDTINWYYVWIVIVFLRHEKYIKKPPQLTVDFRIIPWIFKCTNVTH